jgi:integrase
MWEKLREAAKAKGVRPLELHCTRHTAISLWVSQGVPAKRVAAWVGPSLETTERHYAHVIPSEERPPSILSQEMGRAVAVLLGTRLRRGELIGLQPRDVNVEAQRLHVRRVPTGDKRGETQHGA